MNKYMFYMITAMMGLTFTLGIKAQADNPEHLSMPLVYEYNLKGPLSLESEIIITTGTIKTISAFAEFAGEVRLEVSANGGRSYTRIINGQPLSEGFIPGNQLRFKANIAQGSLLKRLVLGYTDTSGTKKIFSNPEIANFKSRQPLFISGGSQDLFNYPLKVNLEKEIYSQGIYFTAGDGNNPLHYYLEGIGDGSIFSSSSDAKKIEPSPFWVRIPEIPKEGTMIYLYYGGTVPAFSDGNKVFAFFDDFSGAGLDKEKWQKRLGLEGEEQVKDGSLQLKDGAVLSRNFKMGKGILEFKAKAEENAAIQAICRGSLSKHSAYPLEQLVYSSAYPGAEHTIAVNEVAKLNIGKPITALTDYIYKVSVTQQGIIFERCSQDYQKQAEIQFLDVGEGDEGYLGLKADSGPFSGGRVYFDWVRVRPYVEVEPTVKGGKDEK